MTEYLLDYAEDVRVADEVELTASVAASGRLRLRGASLVAAGGGRDGHWDRRATINDEPGRRSDLVLRAFADELDGGTEAWHPLHQRTIHGTGQPSER